MNDAGWIQMLCAATLIGMTAGLRAFTAPCIVSWAAFLAYLDPPTGWIGFIARPYVAWILTALALGEFVTDQLPSTPSRKVPVQFGARILCGGLSGAAIGAASLSLPAGLIAGIVGAVIGPFGGAAARAALARALGRDRPAAIIEDGAAIALGILAVAVA